MRATNNVTSSVGRHSATYCPLRQTQSKQAGSNQRLEQVVTLRHTLRRSVSVSAVSEVEPISATEAKVDPRAAQSNLHRGPRLPGHKRSLALHIAYVGTSFQGGWTQARPLAVGCFRHVAPYTLAQHVPFSVHVISPPPGQERIGLHVKLAYGL